jgi:hypothetical protein
VKESNCILIIHLKHIIRDNSETASKNIHFLKTSNETVIITDVTVCEDILLDQIIELHQVKSDETIIVK